MIILMKYLGLYRILDALTTEFPHVLFESCAGGGGRFDLAMLHFTSQIWTSDNTDALARIFIQHGTSLFYPAIAMASHVSAVPNHQLHRTTPLWTRHVLAMSGVLGYELDLSSLPQSEQHKMRKYIELYKTRVDRLVRLGDLYRLSSPHDSFTAIQTPKVTSWMYVSSCRRHAVMMAVLTSMQEVVLRPSRIPLDGLDPNLRYRVEIMMDREQDLVYGQEQQMHVSGQTLMGAGLLVHFIRDVDAVMVLLSTEV